MAGNRHLHPPRTQGCVTSGPSVLAERLAFGMGCTCLFDERIPCAVSVAAHVCKFDREEQASRVQATRSGSTAVSLRTHARFTAHLRGNISPTEPILTRYRQQKNCSSLAQFPSSAFVSNKFPIFLLTNLFFLVKMICIRRICARETSVDRHTLDAARGCTLADHLASRRTISCTDR